MSQNSQMVPVTNSESSWRDVLARFETCVETPVMCGELANWLDHAHEAYDDVGRVMREDVQPTHAELLRKMSRQDPELLSRVEQLCETEAKLQCDFDHVQLKLAQLGDRAKVVEPDESKLQTPMSEFINASLAFVIAARKQDTAVTTWYLEAFNRDAGEGD